MKNEGGPDGTTILVAVLITLEALAFLVVSLIHFGVDIPIGFAADVEARTPAAIVELICAIFLDLAAVSILIRSPWARAITISAHIAGIMGIVLLVSVFTAGDIRQTGLNGAYRLIMVVLGISGLFLMTARGKAALGGRGKNRKA